MYYSITKRIIKTALGFVILVCSFAFAFFIIHFGSKTDSFNSVWRSFLKIFVIILGEFEFEDLWTNLENSESGITLLFTMLLLVGLVVFGTVIMVNLIVAIIISDIKWLKTVSKEQALLNQVGPKLTLYQQTVYPFTGSPCCPDSCFDLHVWMFF